MEITPAHWLAMFNLVKFASEKISLEDEPLLIEVLTILLTKVKQHDNTTKGTE